MRWIVMIEDPYSKKKYKVYKTEKGARNYIKKLVDDDPHIEKCISLFHEEPVGYKLEHMSLPY